MFQSSLKLTPCCIVQVHAAKLLCTLQFKGFRGARTRPQLASQLPLPNFWGGYIAWRQPVNSHDGLMAINSTGTSMQDSLLPDGQAAQQPNTHHCLAIKQD